MLHRFSFTLMEGKQILSNKYEELNKLGIFQIQLRFDEGIAVLNTVGPGASNSTEQRESLSLDKDEKVKIEIRATQNKFKVRFYKFLAIAVLMNIYINHEFQ